MKLNNTPPIIIIFFVVVRFVLIGIGSGNWVTAICFVVGALFSTMAGYCGMSVATKANVRTANAARVSGMNKALAAGGDTPVHGGLIVSGEWFVDSKEKMGGILEHFPNAKAVDMESCSIAQTCHIYHVPFISFRIISDIPLKDNKASQYFDFWARLAEGSFNVTKHFLQSI